MWFLGAFKFQSQLRMFPAYVFHWSTEGDRRGCLRCGGFFSSGFRDSFLLIETGKIPFLSGDGQVGAACQILAADGGKSPPGK